LAIAIAHEVNQPLSLPHLFAVAEALTEEKLNDPTIIAHREKATAQVERAAVVIKRLRALVRLGRSEITPVAIEQIVEDTLDLVRPVLVRSNIAIDVQIGAGMPPVLADSVQIGQLLINLLRNAAEAISGAAMSEGRITLTAVRNGARFAEVTVADTGPGFPQARSLPTGPVCLEQSRRTRRRPLHLPLDCRIAWRYFPARIGDGWSPSKFHVAICGRLPR
jgi:C4-dicarboxylate-specific signal transduction histidine kinase